MSLRLPRVTWVLCVVLAAAGCSLLVETDHIEAGCPEGWKACGETCVRQDDPRYGCHPAECFEPCSIENGEPMCAASDCVVKRCLWGHRECGGRCIWVLADRANCGDCNVACAAGEICSFGECVPRAEVDGGQ